MVVGVLVVCEAADWSFLLGEVPEKKNDIREEFCKIKKTLMQELIISHELNAYE